MQKIIQYSIVILQEEIDYEIAQKCELKLARRLQTTGIDYIWFSYFKVCVRDKDFKNIKIRWQNNAIYQTILLV